MMEFHPASELFPLMEGAEYDALKADIEAHGLLEPIRVDATTKQIIDGRNRYHACRELGIEPRLEWWEGDDPIDYVLSENLHRRHLGEGQRAMVGARAANMREGRPSETSSIDLVSQAQAAETVNVSVPSLKRAKAVLKSGTGELIKAVDAGKVTVSAAAQAIGLPAEQQREIAEAKDPKRVIRRIHQEGRVIAFGPQCDLPECQYQVIYADPPWRYEHSMDSGDCIENHYPTLALDEIKLLPVPEIAAKDCILFLWTTSPKLKESMQVIDAWGFSYRTCSVWVKDWIGPGYYFRQRHEILLLATRGEPPTPADKDRPDSVQESPREQHSKKPDRYYELIEAMYPNASRIELFARQKRPGWEAWGNEV